MTSHSFQGKGGAASSKNKTLFKSDGGECAKRAGGTIAGKSFGGNTKKNGHFCYIKIRRFVMRKNQVSLIDSLRSS